MAVKIIKKVGTFGQHLGGGFVRTVTGAAWQYMLLPDQPCVKDASTWEQREQAARPMFGILQALADMTPHLTTAGRKANEGFYRQVHILAINASLKYQPSPTLDETNRIRLAREFGDLVEHDRFTLFGVRLNTGGQKEDWKTKTLDIIERLTSASDWEKDEAFDADRNRILDILTSNGCTYPSDMQMQRAFSWWPTTRKPETMPVLIEHQHMHTFPNYKSSYLGQHLEETLLDCDTWTNRIQGSYPLTILTLGAIPWQGQDERTTPNTDWAARMLASVPSGGAGAVALSVRGLVEPGELSREQIDKDKQKVVDKVIEQANSGYKQNLEVAQDLNLASDVYGRDGHPYPTLVKTHTHVAIPQIVEHVDALGYPGVVEANFDRQYQAWEDMQIGSEGTLEYNPSPCFWPAPILAYAGLNGRAFTGDDTGRGLETDLPGALIGMTESDRQPAYDSPFRASIQHRQPFSLCVGSTGSGKQLSLDTLLPVPPQPRFPDGGLVELGSLEEGDLVYGRDGRAYPILRLHPINTRDVFEITFSDGQVVKAGGEHQWGVWSHAARNHPRRAKHVRSLERRRMVETMQGELLARAETVPAGTLWGTARVWDEIKDTLAPLDIKDGTAWVSNTMRFEDVPKHKAPVDSKARPRGRFVEADALCDWLESTKTSAFGWGKWLARLDDLRALDRPVGARDLSERLGVSRPTAKQILRDCNLDYVEPEHHVQRLGVAYDARQALVAVSSRIGARYRDDPDGDGMQVTTTREMLEEGLTTGGGAAQWAVHAAEPIQGERMGLPLDPWCLGAWLADGHKRDGSITSNPDNGDLDYAVSRFREAGFDVHQYGTRKTIGVQGLAPILKKMGVLGNKHIPEPYFHASMEQRLELVRGLLDQDGTIGPNGSIEFTQSADHRPIMDGLVRLLRSLGVIVHEPRFTASGCTSDGERHECQGRWRVTFTTDKPVFGLDRKRRLLPSGLRQTAQWLYVKDIRPVRDCPNRCLTVDSPDHQFLIAGSIPTHNTRLGLHLASQWGRLPDPETGNLIPVVFSDPKPNSDDFTPFVKSRGGRIVRLDSKNAVGLLDPLRCIPDSMWDMQLQTSVEMLSQITGANRSEEMALTSIVAYGHSHGADCLGECVDLAWKAYHGRLPDGDRVAPLVDDLKPVLDRLVVSDPLMPLIYATRHGGVKLSVSSGMTLISAGTLNIITEKEVESAPTAVQRWVCRMVAMGASCLICGRNGMFVCDEAWSLLLDDFGRSVVNRMGRLGRAQHYMALFLSQKADEFVDAGIQEYTSRVYCMALGARNEGEGRDSQAQAACRLMNQPLDGRMHERMMHDRVIDPDSRQPDYESLYALTDPNDGHLLRGSIAYVASGDAGPAIPVEIRVADSLA